jgi:hypothetical protein
MSTAGIIISVLVLSILGLQIYRLMARFNSINGSNITEGKLGANNSLPETFNNTVHPEENFFPLTFTLSTYDKQQCQSSKLDSGTFNPKSLKS